MKEYVLGFSFSKDKKEIILIEKQKPDWQKGKLNGIGGKVELTDKNVYDAMVREFKEETGVETTPITWHLFGCMDFTDDIMGGGAKVWLFKLYDDLIYECITNETEEVFRIDTDSVLDFYSCMHNLPILIPLALSDEFTYTELKQ